MDLWLFYRHHIELVIQEQCKVWEYQKKFKWVPPKAKVCSTGEVTNTSILKNPTVIKCNSSLTFPLSLTISFYMYFRFSISNYIISFLDYLNFFVLCRLSRTTAMMYLVSGMIPVSWVRYAYLKYKKIIYCSHWRRMRSFS